MAHKNSIFSLFLFYPSIFIARRHFLLSNGSLLIVNSGTSDSGKYRCNATNQFAKKLYRNSFSVLNVVSRSGNNDNHGSSLLPALQSSTQKIKSGQNLILHCASHTNKVSWNHSTVIGKKKTRAKLFHLSTFFFLPFINNHRFHGHSRHVAATSQFLSILSTSWSTWTFRWQNMMEFIIARVKVISRWAKSTFTAAIVLLSLF